MIPLVVILGQNISGALYALLSRRLAVVLPKAQLQITAILITVTYTVSLPIALLYGPVYLADLTHWWGYILLGGLTTTLNGAAILLVFRYMDAAMGSLLLTTNSVMAILAAMYILGERLGLQEVTGAAIAFAAVAYALAVHVSKRERRKWGLGIIFTGFSALCFSVGAVTEKFLLQHMGASSYVVWGWGGQWVVAVAFGLMIGARHFRAVLARRNVGLVAAAGVTRSGMGLLFVGSIVMLKSLCIAIVLAGLRPLFVAFLGAWWLGERKFLVRKVVASLVAAIGVAIMFW